MGHANWGARPVQQQFEAPEFLVLGFSTSSNLSFSASQHHNERRKCGTADWLSQSCIPKCEISESVSAVRLYGPDGHQDGGFSAAEGHEERFQRQTTYDSILYAEARLSCLSNNWVIGNDIAKTSKFHVYSQPPTIKTTHPDPLPALQAKQLAKLDPTGARTRLFSRDHADSAKVGDVLMVTTKSGEPFSGAFLQIRRRGVDTAIQLRGQMMKVGVEMWFKIYSPTTTGIDIIWRRPKRARRARLTYMRKPSHDMGSVDQLVFAWKKERYSLRSKGKPGQQRR